MPPPRSSLSRARRGPPAGSAAILMHLFLSAVIPQYSAATRQCGLYLAPSSTNPDPDDEDYDDEVDGIHPPKLGLYAGRTYERHERIGYPEIAVQIYDMEGHTGRSALSPEELDDGGSETKPEHVNFFAFAHQQMWAPDSTGAKYDTTESDGGPGHTYTAIPGVGMLGNFHPGVVNAEWDQWTCRERGVSVDRESASAASEERDHPGRGASSEYYDVTVRATRMVPEGMEIIMDFGAEWTKENTGELEATGEDYDRADKSINALLEFLDKYSADLTPDLSADIYDFLLGEVVPLGSETEEGAAIALSLLPKDVTKLKVVKETGGSLRHHNPGVFRDLRWLKENGQCMDNIRPGPSTVPYAGRGAFATRNIGKGELVSPMPLVHIPHGRELDMYELEEGTNPHTEEQVLLRFGGPDAKPMGKQLLLNYCFGHPKSNILLYPFGTASNFINHATGSKANARIVWSSAASGLKIHQPEWLEVSPLALTGDDYFHVGLAFDVVATRDVKEGEEIFLDYGVEWQKAWDDHVKRFKEEKEGGEHADPTALELNALYHGRASSSSSGGEIHPFKTARELRRDPYPDRVATSCHISYRDVEEEDGAPDDERRVDGLKAYQWTGDNPDVWNGASMRLCEIVSRAAVASDEGVGDADGEEGGAEAKRAFNYTYVAKVTLEETSDETTEVKVVRGIPHDAVRFVDRPYSGDQHRSDAFRHYIVIPDDIFPQAWRDRA